MEILKVLHIRFYVGSKGVSLNGGNALLYISRTPLSRQHLLPHVFFTKLVKTPVPLKSPSYVDPKSSQAVETRHLRNLPAIDDETSRVEQDVKEKHCTLLKDELSRFSSYYSGELDPMSLVPSLCSPAEAYALGTAYANAGWAGRTQITLDGLDAELTRYDARLVNTANQMARIEQVREDSPRILYDFLVFPRKSGYTMPNPLSLSAKQEEVEKKYSDSPKFKIGGWQIRPNCNQVSNDID